MEDPFVLENRMIMTMKVKHFVFKQPVFVLLLGADLDVAVYIV